MLKVGYPDLIKGNLGTLAFQEHTLIVLHPKRYEIGHIDLIAMACNSPKFHMCHTKNYRRIR